MENFKMFSVRKRAWRYPADNPWLEGLYWTLIRLYGFYRKAISEPCSYHHQLGKTGSSCFPTTKLRKWGIRNIMTKFIEKPTAITPNRELQSDEYFNETDHLIYCSKCNTPRQCRHELQGKVLIPSIRCKCQQEIFEQEEAQRKLHENKWK